MRLAALAVTAVCLTIVAPPAIAAQTPRGGSLDQRITSVVYQENNVVQVSATYGISTMIIFDEDEKFQTISLGDTEPPRVCRRPSGLSYAAMAGSSSMA